MLGYRLGTAVAVVMALFIESGVMGSEQLRIPLRVLYLSRTNDPVRTTAFTEFLTLNFASCRTESRDAFQREFTNDIDVVLLDWSQRERRSENEPSPIGELEDWKHPIVLLGSAGLLISKRWRVIGDAG
jgi:hypothetical protein